MIGAQLYLPKKWLEEDKRKLGRIPETVEFKTKHAIALDLLKKANKQGPPKTTVLADAGYGDSREFRDEVLVLGHDFAMGVTSKTRIWRPVALLGMPDVDKSRVGVRTKK